MILNRVYRLFTKEMDAKQREAFDAELYAPAEGWDMAERHMWAAMAAYVDQQQDGGS